MPAPGARPSAGTRQQQWFRPRAIRVKQRSRRIGASRSGGRRGGLLSHGCNGRPVDHDIDHVAERGRHQVDTAVAGAHGKRLVPASARVLPKPLPDPTSTTSRPAAAAVRRGRGFPRRRQSRRRARAPARRVLCLRERAGFRGTDGRARLRQRDAYCLLYSILQASARCRSGPDVRPAGRCVGADVHFGPIGIERTRMRPKPRPARAAGPSPRRFRVALAPPCR